MKFKKKRGFIAAALLVAAVAAGGVIAYVFNANLEASAAQRGSAMPVETSFDRSAFEERSFRALSWVADLVDYLQIDVEGIDVLI